MLKEAGAVLTESERPLGYAATVVTILGVAAVIAYLLTLAGVPGVDAVAFGFLVALLGLAGFYLALALRRGARASGVLESVRSEKIRAEARTSQLEGELATARKDASDEHDRLTKVVADRDAQIVSLKSDLAEANRVAEEERRSTERAKISPAMDPFYRFEGHLIRKDHYWVGVENKGLGPAEEVTLTIGFRSDTETWESTKKPYISVLEKGSKEEFELSPSHFDRSPSEMTITVEYADLTGLRHKKSVGYSFKS